MQSVHASHRYMHTEIKWSMRHADILSEKPTELIPDLRKFHNLEAAEWRAEPGVNYVIGGFDELHRQTTAIRHPAVARTAAAHEPLVGGANGLACRHGGDGCRVGARAPLFGRVAADAGSRRAPGAGARV